MPIKLLTPWSDREFNFSYNITPGSNIKVTQIKELITDQSSGLLN